MSNKKAIAPNLVYQPVIKNGVPKFEPDSKEYKKFWDEEIDRCINGYKPHGHPKITGKYYFHLNHWKITRLRIAYDGDYGSEKILSFPLYRDVDHEFFDRLENNIRLKRDMIIGKRRRIGASDNCISAIAQELLFFKKNQCGIGVPFDNNLEKIMPKFDTGINELPSALAQKFLINNADQRKFGVEYPTKEGKKIGGSQSILFTNYFSKAGIFKGSWMSLLLMDEVGEFKQGANSLRSCYAQSKECVGEGGNKFGIIILAGTSDKANNLSDDYEFMCDNADILNLDFDFIPATKWYFIEDKKESCYDITTGKSDDHKAYGAIMKERERLSQLPDKSTLFQFMQNNPIVPSDMFIATQDNFINIALVNDRIQAIHQDAQSLNHCTRGNLIPFVDANGKEVPAKWKFKPDPQGRWNMTEPPINDLYKDADIIGLDDYLKDKAEHSDSKGGVVVYRRFINFNIPCKFPVCTYWYRPALRSMLFDDVIATAEFYGAQIAAEINDEGFYNHCKDKGKLHLLKQYPVIRGKAVRKKEAYGYSVKTDEINSIKQKVADFVESQSLQNVFDLEILKQLTQYGKKNTDLISALGICFLYEDDIAKFPVRKLSDGELPEDEKPERVKQGFILDERGNIKPAIPISNTPTQMGWESTLGKRYGVTIPNTNPMKRIPTPSYLQTDQERAYFESLKKRFE